MREVRLALLEADVNFEVVKEFVAHVRERALGADVAKSLTPGQQVVKIVHEELTELMGSGSSKLAFSPRPPTTILLAGLQGSGKTTTAGKLALLLAERRPEACARRRRPPAACRDRAADPARRAGRRPRLRRRARRPGEGRPDGIERAKADGRDVVILDTAGRLQIDEPLMEELAAIRREAKPTNVLLVLDAMTGQEAVNVAQAFQERVDFDGVVHDEARRRRARRRGALREGRHRQADQARVRRREARPARVVPPGPDGVADPRHGRRADADRARRGRGRRRREGGARAPHDGGRVHASTTSSSATR